MSFSYDVSTDLGKVRMLIPDRDYEQKFFEDEELEAMLGMEGARVKAGAALALETMASDQAMVLKVIRVLDLTTDGQKTSQALLERAALLRAQAALEDEAEEGGAFDVAELVYDDFSYRNRLVNEVMRNQ